MRQGLCITASCRPPDSTLFSASVRLRETLIVSWSSQAIKLLMLMHGIDQFTINPREIDIFLGPLCESELVYKSCHGPLPPCQQSLFKQPIYILA
jgi:hypothetical protein